MMELNSLLLFPGRHRLIDGLLQEGSAWVLECHRDDLDAIVIQRGDETTIGLSGLGGIFKL